MRSNTNLVKPMWSLMHSQGSLISTLSLYSLHWTWTISHSSINRIPTLHPSWKHFKILKMPLKNLRAKHFELQGNRIYLKEGNRMAILKDKRLRTQILQEHHDINISGHLGIDKTYKSLRRNYYWPKMGKDVYKFITTCDSCQRNKPSNQQPAGLLQPLNTPTM